MAAAGGWSLPRLTGGPGDGDGQVPPITVDLLLSSKTKAVGFFMNQEFRRDGSGQRGDPCLYPIGYNDQNEHRFSDRRICRMGWMPWPTRRVKRASLHASSNCRLQSLLSSKPRLSKSEVIDDGQRQSEERMMHDQRQSPRPRAI